MKQYKAGVQYKATVSDSVRCDHSHCLQIVLTGQHTTLLDNSLDVVCSQTVKFSFVWQTQTVGKHH